MSADEVAEIKRHFGVVSEGLRDEIRTVAEGLATVSEKVDTVGGDLAAFRKEVREGFDRGHKDAAETRAMLQLSHGELERRIVDVDSGRR